MPKILKLNAATAFSIRKEVNAALEKIAMSRGLHVTQTWNATTQRLRVTAGFVILEEDPRDLVNLADQQNYLMMALMKGLRTHWLHKTYVRPDGNEVRVTGLKRGKTLRQVTGLLMDGTPVRLTVKEVIAGFERPKSG